MIILKNIFKRQGCVGAAWCPECKQVIKDSICLCMGHCDKHGRVLTLDFPDGDLVVRYTNKEPNGWLERFKDGKNIGFKRADKEEWYLH